MSITKLDCIELQNTKYSVYPYNGYNLEEILGKFYEAIKECNDLSFSLQEFNQWILSQGLAEEVLKQLSKVDWDNVVNSELYQKVIDRLLNTNNRIEEVKNEVELELNGKITYFKNVNEMKASNKIKLGSICKTFGYYRSGDGGGAIYLITDNSPLGNGLSFSLSNGLTAELLYNDEISIKQLGARSYDEHGNKIDIKPFIEMYISITNPIGNTNNKKTIKLFIPSGRWFSSDTNLTSSSLYIEGLNIYSYPYGTGTIIMPLTDNQEKIWVIGSDTTDSLGLEYGNICLKNIMFSTYNPKESDGIYLGGLSSDKCYSCKKILHISRVYGATFENIYFTNYIGTPLSINSSSEIIFNDFTFRNGDAFDSGNVVFETDITGNKNISACFFDKFSFEGVKGDLFNFKKDSKFINNHIGTILFEDRDVNISKNGSFKNYTIASDGERSFSSKSIFNIEEQAYCELNVDNVLLNNFGRVIFTLNEIEYLFDTIVKENGKISKGQVNIKNISHTGARRDTILLNKTDYEGLGSFNFKFTCENANHVDTDTYKFMIKTSGSMKPFIRYKEIGYNRCVDYVTSPKSVFTKNGKSGYYMPVVTDEESITNEKLVIDNLQFKRYVPTFNPEPSCFDIPVIGNKLHIRAKTKTGFLAHCYSERNVTYQNYTKNSVGEEYKWYTIDFTEYRTQNIDKELNVAIRTLTADETNYVKLDVFYWE